MPIYAHELELPYVSGSASYPPPDPSVGGGLMAMLSPMYPRGPIDVSRWVKPLPADGSVPCMPGWKWIHAPGHTPGQVSLWREGDRTLIAADAFITTNQESAYAVAVQKPEMHGRPCITHRTGTRRENRSGVWRSLRLSWSLPGTVRRCKGRKCAGHSSISHAILTRSQCAKGRYVERPVGDLFARMMPFSFSGKLCSSWRDPSIFQEYSPLRLRIRLTWT